MPNVIRYFEGGGVRKIAEPNDHARSAGVVVRRASHVVPVNFVLRFLFQLLRTIFGDNGRVAAWTRRWPCQWYADMAPLNGPLLGPCRNRDIALYLEKRWIALHWILEKAPAEEPPKQPERPSLLKSLRAVKPEKSNLPSLVYTDDEPPTIANLTHLKDFEFNGHVWRVASDALGFLLFKDGRLDRAYASRAGFARDILLDIGIIEKG